MDIRSAVAALAALAHPVRLEAFRTLVQAGHEGLAQMDLARAVGVAPTNLVFHLKELASARLVTQTQAGRRVIYCAAYDQMDELVDFLMKNCCKGVAVPETADSDACSC